jgi:hypothetical protein
MIAAQNSPPGSTMGSSPPKERKESMGQNEDGKVMTVGDMGKKLKLGLSRIGSKKEGKGEDVQVEKAGGESGYSRSSSKSPLSKNIQLQEVVAEEPEEEDEDDGCALGRKPTQTPSSEARILRAECLKAEAEEEENKVSTSSSNKEREPLHEGANILPPEVRSEAATMEEEGSLEDNHENEIVENSSIRSVEEDEDEDEAEQAQWEKSKSVLAGGVEVSYLVSRRMYWVKSFLNLSGLPSSQRFYLSLVDSQILTRSEIR